MADIDKGLPNTRTEVKVPGEEVEIKEEIKEQQPVEVTPEEDGGATIDFEPGAINIPGTEKHFDNLATSRNYWINKSFGFYSEDRRAIMWDTKSGQRMSIFEGHTSLVTSTVMGPFGDILVTTGHDNLAILWDIKTGKRKMTYQEYCLKKEFTSLVKKYLEKIVNVYTKIQRYQILSKQW